jgi:hypothetical protein
MLSEHDREILKQLEADLRPGDPLRDRVVGTVRGTALLAAAIAVVVLTTLTADGRLLPTVGAPLIAVLGTLTGWQLLGHCRRYALGPQLRWHCRVLVVRVRHRKAG